MGRGKGPGVGLGLLMMCFVLALTPVGEPVQSAGGEAEVEVPVVALTFDDGPRWDTTSWLLEQLELREVPATFFYGGQPDPRQRGPDPSDEGAGVPDRGTHL